MTTHEFALSALAARLAGTDAILTTAIRDILAAALQELIETELTATIGAAPGEHTPARSGDRWARGRCGQSLRPCRDPVRELMLVGLATLERGP